MEQEELKKMYDMGEELCSMAKAMGYDPGEEEKGESEEEQSGETQENEGEDMAPMKELSKGRPGLAISLFKKKL